MKMLFCAVLIDSLHATFEHTEIAFNGIGVNGERLPAREYDGVGIANVFILGVSNRLVAREVLA